MSNEDTIMSIAEAARAAVPTVHGIAAARLVRNEDDTAMLIADHLRESEAAGLSPQQAWSALFSASIIVLGDALRLGGQPDVALRTLAMNHQLDQP